MKTNLKYQNARLPSSKKSKRESLFFEAAAVIAINLLCVAVLTPLYKWLGYLCSDMSVDAARDGSFLHAVCEVGAGVLFYLSSFLGTAAFFIGAAYVERFALRNNISKAVGGGAVLYIGMSVPTVLTLLALFVLKLSDPSVTLSEPLVLLYDALFMLFRVAVITAAAVLLSRRRVKVHVQVLLCCVFMFLCGAGLELAENIPFFLKGTVLAQDVFSMVVSMLLYAIHATLGYIIMMRLLRK